ncbi:MAG: hypothetical protein MI717_09105 [Spirochaetales bacterium]|nr:hypothetical protein [Spirochaetales bacterium]
MIEQYAQDGVLFIQLSGMVNRTMIRECYHRILACYRESLVCVFSFDDDLELHLTIHDFHECGSVVKSDVSQGLLRLVAFYALEGQSPALPYLDGFFSSLNIGESLFLKTETLGRAAMLAQSYVSLKPQEQPALRA